MRMLRGVVVGIVFSAGLVGAEVDPTADNFNPGPDLTGLTACQAPGGMVLRLDFADIITAPPASEPNTVHGYIDLDFDRNGGTGTPPFVDANNPGGALSGLGAEAVVLIGDYDPVSGTMPFGYTDVVFSVPVPAVFEAQRLTVTLPIAAGEAPNGFDLATVVGHSSGPTDVAPNTGSITTTSSCCGNGFLDAGEPCDGSPCCSSACEAVDTPAACDDGDPCSDESCVLAVGDCSYADRTGIPGAACAFDRATPALCTGQPVKLKTFEKAAKLVDKAGANPAKQAKLLAKAVKRIRAFVAYLDRQVAKGTLDAACADGLRTLATDALARVERAATGG